jgi:outer membrane murein-binding lipoprotein Lpp
VVAAFERLSTKFERLEARVEQIDTDVTAIARRLTDGEGEG